MNVPLAITNTGYTEGYTGPSGFLIPVVDYNSQRFLTLHSKTSMEQAKTAIL